MIFSGSIIIVVDTVIVPSKLFKLLYIPHKRFVHVTTYEKKKEKENQSIMQQKQ